MHPSSTRLQAKQNHDIVVNICFNNDWIMFSELSTTNSLHKSYRVCLGSVFCFLHQIFTHTRGPPQNGTHRFIWKASVRDHYKGPAALIHHILHIYLNPLHCFFLSVQCNILYQPAVGYACGKPALPTAGWLQRIVMVKYTISSKCLHIRTFKKKKKIWSLLTIILIQAQVSNITLHIILSLFI